MITLFFIALTATAVSFASVPVVLFALMMETCERRAGHARAELSHALVSMPRRLEMGMTDAAIARVA
jgi:hypothetical protein